MNAIFTHIQLYGTTLLLFEARNDTLSTLFQLLLKLCQEKHRRPIAIIAAVFSVQSRLGEWGEERHPSRDDEWFACDEGSMSPVTDEDQLRQTSSDLLVMVEHW